MKIFQTINHYFLSENLDEITLSDKFYFYGALVSIAVLVMAVYI